MPIKYINLTIASVLFYVFAVKEKSYANFGFYPKSFIKLVLFAAGRCWLSLIYNIAAF